MSDIAVALCVFAVAFFMSMAGKGGGNFYILIMLAAGISMHSAAVTSQLIMIAAAIVSVFVYHRDRKIDWKLALVLDPPTDIMAFAGGYFAGSWDASVLKTIFAISLIIVSLFMFMPAAQQKRIDRTGPGFWKRDFGGESYTVDLRFAVPITAAVGFMAGAVGISGGTFKIPLMVLACGVPMKTAVATSSAMVGVTALMGFMGHFASGSIDFATALPLALAGFLGGLAGSRNALKTKPENLKKIFASVNLLAGILMLFSLFMK